MTSEVSLALLLEALLIWIAPTVVTAVVATNIVVRLLMRLPWLPRVAEATDRRARRNLEVPRFGGIAVLFGLSVAYAVALVLRWERWVQMTEGVEILALAIGGGLIFLVGLVDDLVGLRPPQKILVQTIAAALVIRIGWVFEVVQLPGLGAIDLGSAGVLVTIVWIVGVTNAINLIDGLDGLAGGLAAIVAASLLVYSLLRGDLDSAVALAAMLGASLGFLRHNWAPARMYLGDSGSLLLGFLFAAFSLRASVKTPAAVAILLPILALGLPVIDTLLVMVLRFGEGRGRRLADRLARMFHADSAHVHHLLGYAVASRRAIVVILYAVMAAFCCAALVVALTGSSRLGLSFLAIEVGAVMAMRWMGRRAKLHFGAAGVRPPERTRVRAGDAPGKGVVVPPTGASRFLYLCDWLPPDFGAVGQYALIEARQRAAAGQRVTLVGLSSSSSSVEQVPVGSGELRIVRLRRPLYDRSNLLRRLAWTLVTDVRLLWSARRELWRADEILFTGSPPFLIHFLVPLSALLPGRLTYRIADFHPECLVAALGRTPLALRALLVWTRFLRRRVARFEVLGQDQRRRLLECGVAADRIEVLRQGSPVEIPTSTRPLALPSRLAGRVVLLYSGNFGVAHDDVTLLEGLRLHHERGRGRVGLWLNASGAKADRLEAGMLALGLPFHRSRPVALEQLARLLVTPHVHLVTLRDEFVGYVMPSKIYGCVDSGRPLLFIGSEESDVHRIARERLSPDRYWRCDVGDAEGVARALDEIGTSIAAASRGSRVRKSDRDRSRIEERVETAPEVLVARVS